MNILITAIAGDIGFGAGRILRKWGWLGSLHGADAREKHPGLAVFDRVSLAPPATDPTYLAWLEDYVTNNDINIVLPTSESEIGFFAAEKLSVINSAPILTNSPFTVKTSLDKFECMSFLASRGVAVPRNGLVGAGYPTIFPVIAKPRFGRGGRGLQHLDSMAEFREKATAGEVWQEYLSPGNKEFTCAIYRSERRPQRNLIMRRELHHGTTSNGEVVVDDDIEHYLTQIAEALNVEGAINIQLRLTNQGPLLFEINPRLSSTLVLRDEMGFHDLRWWLDDVAGSENTPHVPQFTRPRAGTIFFRGFQEYVFPTRA